MIASYAGERCDFHEFQLIDYFSRESFENLRNANGQRLVYFRRGKFPPTLLRALLETI